MSRFKPEDPDWVKPTKRRNYRCEKCGHLLVFTTNHTEDIETICQGNCYIVSMPDTIFERRYPKKTIHFCEEASKRRKKSSDDEA